MKSVNDAVAHPCNSASQKSTALVNIGHKSRKIAHLVSGQMSYKRFKKYFVIAQYWFTIYKMGQSIHKEKVVQAWSYLL